MLGRESGALNELGLSGYCSPSSLFSFAENSLQ
jgi:hypothetical protein